MMLRRGSPANGLMFPGPVGNPINLDALLCISQKGRTSSELVAEMAVGARLVKSISNMPMNWIQDFSAEKPKTVLFVSGDDRDAKAVVVDLLNSTGLVALDLGSLAAGGAMQQLG